MDLNYPIVIYLFFFLSSRKNRNGGQENIKNDRNRMDSKCPIVFYFFLSPPEKIEMVAKKI